MPVISGSIPKLTDGVSQQAITLRLNTAVQDQNNAWLSVVTGNQKRPPSKIIKKLGSVETGSVASTIIDRFDGKKFIVVLKNGSVRVFDASTGNEKTVNTPDGLGYLSSALETDYDFVTVADTTFICNKTTVVATNTTSEDPSLRLDPDRYWSIFVKEAVPNSNYAIYLNNNLVANFTTANNIDISNVLQRTSTIASNLGTSLANASNAVGSIVGVTNTTLTGALCNSGHNSITYNLTGGSGTGAKVKVVETNNTNVAYWTMTTGGSGYTVGNTLTLTGVSGLANQTFTVTGVTTTGNRDVTRNNSTITVLLNADDKVGVDDGNGGSSMTVFGTDIANFSKLPPQDKENRIVLVKGEIGDSGDDYYVKYVDNLWRETYGYGMNEYFDNSTMPHVLVYDVLTDTFTFKRHTWKDRVVGDDDTNPVPSFVKQTIQSMSLYRGRLVMLSGENVVLSEADNYENFFRSTVIQLLDSEIIDIAAVTGRQANLFHTVQWNKKLLVFSDKSQFVLESGQVLSPKTAYLTASSAYDVSKTVKPISMDSSVYFVEDSGTYAKLYQYMMGTDGLNEEADLSSIQVPEFISSPVRRMVGIPKASAIFIQGSDLKKLYVYKYMDGPQGKIQSAWNTWEFTQDIKAINVSGSVLYIFSNGIDGLYLSSINIEDDAVRTASNLVVYLDNQIPLTATTRSYNSGTDLTTFTLPYAYDTTKLKLVNTSGGGLVGFYPVINILTSTTFTVQGDWSSVVGVVGHQYEYSLTFSPFILRESKNNATAAIQDGVLSIRYMSFNYEDTAYFKVTVKNKGGATIQTEYSGFMFGEEESIIGTVPLASGEYRFPVFEDGRYVEIKITNDSPFHSCFSSAEWYGQWTPKAKQRF